MCGRNVLQIGMYLSVELWGEAIFLYPWIVILFIYLFVALLLIFVGWRPQTFTSFVLFFVHHFPVEGEQFMQQYSKKRVQPSDVKTPKPVIDASMPKVMYIV